MAATRETLDQIKDVLRGDLRLGSAAAIEDDMPLVGGDHDLDSLDILLLVTTIEKRFGIKISNETIGREAFSTVESLAEFVEQQQSAESS